MIQQIRLFIFFVRSYIRRRDLHTVLPQHTLATLNQGPRLSKTNSVDEKSDANIHRNLKRTKSNSISSETGITPDSDAEVLAKRAKMEQIQEVNDESSPKTSETPASTE